MANGNREDGQHGPTINEIRDVVGELVAEGLVRHSGRFRPGRDGKPRPEYETTEWGRVVSEHFIDDGEDPVERSRQLRRELVEAGEWKPEWDVALPTPKQG